MTTAFQADAFQNDAFQVDGAAPPVVVVPSVGSAGGAWHHLGPARFKKYRDERHPEEVKKRLQEAFEKATGELSTMADRHEAVAAVKPYATTLQDLAPGKLEGIAPDLPAINWAAVAEQIDAEHAGRLLAIEQRIDEEEHALMHLLLHG